MDAVVVVIWYIKQITRHTYYWIPWINLFRHGWRWCDLHQNTPKVEEHQDVIIIYSNIPFTPSLLTNQVWHFISNWYSWDRTSCLEIMEYFLVYPLVAIDSNMLCRQQSCFAIPFDQVWIMQTDAMQFLLAIKMSYKCKFVSPNMSHAVWTEMNCSPRVL